jgi:hypothetical protein
VTFSTKIRRNGETIHTCQLPNIAQGTVLRMLLKRASLPYVVRVKTSTLDIDDSTGEITQVLECKQERGWLCR